MDKEIIDILYGEETTKIYKDFQKIEEIVKNSNQLYLHFNEFIKMLKSDKSFIRVRGFRIICLLAKWDKDNKIESNIDILLSTLDDDKPTSIRQHLKSLDTLLTYKPNLINIVLNKIKTLNYTKFKDTMSPLIKKDIEYLLKKY